MIRIGLTGGIASGKSTVSTMLRELGACIVDADQLARQIVEPGKPAWQDIRNIFGDSILLDNKSLDRRALGDIVFHDDEKRAQLEAITHPRIAEAAEAELRLAAKQGYSAAVLDAPLLIEVGWTKMVDTVWLVYVDANTQLERLMKRDGFNWEQAMSRIASQMRLQDKLSYANVVINNGNSLEETRKQVRKAWAKLIPFAFS